MTFIGIEHSDLEYSAITLILLVLFINSDLSVYMGALYIK